MSLQQQNNNLQVKKNNRIAKFYIMSYSGNQQDHIYANENMQCGILIKIRAADSTNNTIILSDEQLNSIELINYATNETLSGNWSYSSVENNYSHTFPFVKNLQVSDPLYEEVTNGTLESDTIQRKLYWVTTKKEEAIMISARITFDGKTYIAESKAFGSAISVVGHAPIIYRAADLVWSVIENVNSGIFNVHEKIETYYGVGGSSTKEEDFTRSWSQNNHYLAIKNGFVVRNIAIWNTTEDNNRKSKDFRRFAHLTYKSSFEKQEDLYLWFIWGVDAEDRVIEVGAMTKKHTHSLGSGGISVETYSTDPKVMIHTTTHTDTINISRLYFQSPAADFWANEASNAPCFIFYDAYGNKSGTIQIEMDNYNQFHLKDREMMK
ncbi:hypothetical protein [Xenorhabdus entomophaga]|uniref:hypothetical protein n=1 Tax=Xenorhabdus entomophaga TaxID=3136257 RepID=UPI0030F39148